MVGWSDATFVLCILTLVVLVLIPPSMHMFALFASTSTLSMGIPHDQVQCKTSMHGLSLGCEASDASSPKFSTKHFAFNDQNDTYHEAGELG